MSDGIGKLAYDLASKWAESLLLEDDSDGEGYRDEKCAATYVEFRDHCQAIDKQVATLTAALAEAQSALKVLIASDDDLRAIRLHQYAAGSPVDKQWSVARKTLKRIDAAIAQKKS